MPELNIKDKIIFITGANRGIGKAFALKALELGAKKVYACSRDVDKLEDLVAADDKRVIPVALDVTNQDQINAAAASAKDVDVLINNAGMGEVLERQFLRQKTKPACAQNWMLIISALSK